MDGSSRTMVLAGVPRPSMRPHFTPSFYERLLEVLAERFAFGVLGTGGSGCAAAGCGADRTPAVVASASAECWGGRAVAMIGVAERTVRRRLRDALGELWDEQPTADATAREQQVRETVHRTVAAYNREAVTIN